MNKISSSLLIFVLTSSLLAFVIGASLAFAENSDDKTPRMLRPAWKNPPTPSDPGPGNAQGPKDPRPDNAQGPKDEKPGNSQGGGPKDPRPDNAQGPKDEKPGNSQGGGPKDPRPDKAQGPKDNKPGNGQGPKGDLDGPHGIIKKVCEKIEDDDDCNALAEYCQWCATDANNGKCVTKKFSCCKYATDETSCKGGTIPCGWWTSAFQEVPGRCYKLQCKDIKVNAECSSAPDCVWTDDVCVKS